MIDRRHILLGSGLSLLPACATAAPGAQTTIASPERATKAVEMTFLRSLDPDPTLAARFIKANWFAMDAIAQARGLMTFFTLHIDPSAREDWNLVVQVGYPDPRGFESIRTQWADIVAAHETVPIEGKRLPDLARVLGTRRIVPA